MQGAHFAPLAKLLNTSTFCAREEAEELLHRKQTKEKLGYIPRPRNAPERCSQVGVRPKDFAPEDEHEFDLEEMS